MLKAEKLTRQGFLRLARLGAAPTVCSRSGPSDPKGERYRNRLRGIDKSTSPGREWSVDNEGADNNDEDMVK